MLTCSPSRYSKQNCQENAADPFPPTSPPLVAARLSLIYEGLSSQVADRLVGDDGAQTAGQTIIATVEGPAKCLISQRFVMDELAAESRSAKGWDGLLG